jgi:hypothetical protein
MDGGQVSEPVAEGKGAHPISRARAGLSDCDGLSQQRVEAGREKELEVLDASQPFGTMKRLPSCASSITTSALPEISPQPCTIHTCSFSV